MALMPGLQEQNTNANTVGHDTNKFSAVLSEMQAYNLSECTTTEYLDYRARRKGAEPTDAEPIIVG